MCGVAAGVRRAVRRAPRASRAGGVRGVRAGASRAAGRVLQRAGACSAVSFCRARSGTAHLSLAYTRRSTVHKVARDIHDTLLLLTPFSLLMLNTCHVFACGGKAGSQAMTRDRYAGRRCWRGTARRCGSAWTRCSGRRARCFGFPSSTSARLSRCLTRCTPRCSCESHPSSTRAPPSSSP